VPFLIDLGWFEEGGFATRQLFVRDYAEERAALVDPASVISRRGIVSYACTGVSWAGVLLAGVSALILVFE